MPVSCVQQSGVKAPLPPPCPPLIFRTWGRTHSAVRDNKKGGPRLRRLCGWTALGGAGGQTGAAAARGGAAGTAAGGAAFQTL